ncbi:MAG: TIGR03862 family flavoprotein, partial [Pseudomonadota bacterium]
MIGAGPAGLAVAEMLAGAGHRVVVFEAKPSAARKFLLAGKSGLNLTKDEAAVAFRGAIACPPLDPILAAFGPAEAMAWAEGLGEPLFTGSSGRVFPVAMKGSPLLRRWLARLSGQGVELRTRWRWTGWEGSALRLETPKGPRLVEAGATVLALGGASWPRLGSDGAWVPWLKAAGVEVRPFRPANMGFEVPWSAHFAERFQGHPVKPAALTIGRHRVVGEFAISAYGIEGSAVYAISAPLREALAAGETVLRLDLFPGRKVGNLRARLARPRGRNSRANHWRKALGLTGVRAGLVRELA